MVIDDLHELDWEDALAWLEMLLTRLPAQLRVVLATREEPALGLHRLRLAGELTELRGPDLRFSLDETRALLRASGITLSDTGLASLHERTEGWPAGVRLAAISLAAHPDPERFVSEFSGSERTVAGYLLAEVLERQPPEVRELLLRTSLLERVSGPLADALTGGTGAEAILQRLEDQNAFVTALDAARSWFRYHHLFADLLRLELRRVAPETIPSLHRAAAAWHEQEGDVVEAVRHHQAAGDWAPAARLLVDNYLTLTMDGRGETLHALLGAFPADAHLGDGNLAAALAIDNILHGLLDEAAAQLDVARRLAAAAPAERRRVFDVYLAVIEVELARRRSDLPKAREATRGLEAALGAAAETNELPVRPDYWALALLNLGIAELWAGRPDDARQHLEDALGRTRRISRPFIEVGCLAHLAIAAPLTGQPLPLALELSERAIAIAEEHGWTGQSMTTGAFAMAGMALVRMGRLAEAERHLARAEESLRAAADPGTEVWSTTPAACSASARAASTRRWRSSPARRAWNGCWPASTCSRSMCAAGLSRCGCGWATRSRRGMVGRLEPGTTQPRRDADRARGSGAREGQPGTGGRGAGAGDRRLCAGAVRALGARRGTAARRHGPRSARRPARGGGVARGGSRARRARRPGPALHALAEPRAARAPPETPNRPRDADLDDPRHAGRARRSARGPRRRYATS